LAERVTLEYWAEDEIDYQNLRESGSILRPEVASAAGDDMMVVVVVVKVGEPFQFGDDRGHSSTDGMSLWR
jgi:hypothetical protein